MNVIKFDIEIPYWCSFKQFGTVNIQQTYPLPPPSTIFGMIQNSLGKLHKDYNGFEKLKFSIIIRREGEKIDNYSNILKWNRDKNYSRSALNDELSSEKKELIKTMETENINQKLIEKEIKKYEMQFWQNKVDKFGAYKVEKKLMKTQIMKQKLINPKYTIILFSEDNNEYSIENISKHLRSPKRPLYIGENDDMVIVTMKGDGICKLVGPSESSYITSVIGGIYPNSNIIKLPLNIRDLDNQDKNSIIVSIPKGDLGINISCFSVDGENIVFM